MEALGDLAGKKLEAPRVWVPTTPTAHPCYFEPHDLSGLALSINCKELFYVKKVKLLRACKCFEIGMSTLMHMYRISQIMNHLLQ